jgi:hypothetical protein
VAGVYEYSYTNIVLTIMAILLTLVIAGFAWFHRRINGATHLIVLTLTGTSWGLIYLAELLVKPPALRLILEDIQYVPASFLAPIFLLLTLVFTGRFQRYRKWRWLLYVVPLLTVVVITGREIFDLFRLFGVKTGTGAAPGSTVNGPW